MAAGTNITLTAVPASGNTFTGWSGACSGSSTTCTVTVSSNTTVGATFTAPVVSAPITYTATVTRSGTGSGTVTATGISCGADCSEPYAGGTTITFTASPDAGSTFTGWSGACSGSATTCTVTLSSSITVGATFAATQNVSLTAPTELQVTESYYAQSASTASIEFYLRWKDNTSAEDGYLVEESVNRGPFTVVKTLPANTTVFIDRADAASLYQYRVRAYKGASQSAPSNTLEFSGIQQPVYFLVETPTVNSATVYFYDRSRGVLGYQVERSDDGGATYTVIARRAASQYEYVPNAHGTLDGYKKLVDDNGGVGLRSGTTYYYRVAAYNDIGLSAYAPADVPTALITPYITVAPGGAPIAPTFGATLTQTPSVKLRIGDNSNNEAKFDIEKTVDGNTWSLVCTMSYQAGDKSCEDTKITPGAKYTYRAKAYNPGASSPYVYSSQIVIPGVAPAGVTVWYVWKGALAGANTGESWANAWQDIDQINWKAIKPGDTIYISGDNYGKNLTIFTSGTAANPVKIYTGALAPNPSGHNGKVTLTGIILNQSSSWVTIDGSLSTSYALKDGYGVDGNINLFVESSPSHGIFSSADAQGVNVRFVKVSNSNDIGIVFNGYSDDIELYGVHVSYTGSSGIKNSYPGRQSRYDTFKITKSLIEYAGDDAITTAGTMTIAGTIIRYNNPNVTSGHPDGIQGLNANYLDVHDTIIYDRDKSSYMIVNEFVKFSANSSTNFGHIRIYNNIFYYTDPSISPVTEGIYVSASSLNNTLVGPQTWDDILIANNLFYNTPNTAPINFGVRDVNPSVQATNMIIKNNLLYNVAKNLGTAFSFNSKIQTDSTVEIDNNLIAGYVTKMLYKGTFYNTPEAFNAATGYTGNTSQTPQFANLAGYDFRLGAADTAARGNGQNLSAYFTTDRDGNARSATGAWDIGPYVSGAAASGQNPVGQPTQPTQQPTADSSLITYFNFDTDVPSAGIFADKSGNGNNANCQKSFIVNGILYTHDQCPGAATGPDNSPALVFAGTLCDMDSDYLALPKSSSLASLPRGTVSLWVSSADTYTNQKILDSFMDKANTWTLGKDGDLYYTLTVNSDIVGETDTLSFPGNKVAVNTWNHYAFSWDGSYLRGYFNGILFQEVPMTGISALAITDYLAIGAMKHNEPRNTQDFNCGTQYQWAGMPIGPYVYPNAGFFTGKLDEVRIYNRPLAESEIATLASKTTSPSTLKVLRVSRSGSGYGAIVDAAGGGISCGKHCAEAYPAGSLVTLTAKPNETSIFAGWSGACSGTASCTVTMNDLRSVTATFTTKYPLVKSFTPADAVITAPFKTYNGILYQGVLFTSPSAGGKAAFTFTAPVDGDYYVVAKANAPSGSNNSFYINMDTEPVDDTMAWHMNTTAGFEDRIVSWAGSTNGGNPPKVFTLSAGPHTLIVRGREGGTYITNVSILRKDDTYVPPVESPTSQPTIPQTDITPPIVSSTGTVTALPGSTNSVSLTVRTNEIATCKWSLAANQLYAAMPNSFTASTDGLGHTASIMNLFTGINNIYVRCSDKTGNANTSDTVVSITIGGGSQTQSPVTANDLDGDGVANVDDKCPNTKPGLQVNRFGCPLPIATKYTITDLTNTDLNAVQVFEIKNSLGRVYYNQGTYTLAKSSGDSIDLDANVLITKNVVSLDSIKIPELNKSANITLYGVTVTTPKIMRDGAECTTCKVVSYSGGTLVFTVTGFSTYSVVEGAAPQPVNGVTPYTISVSKLGTGSGLVFATGISCGSECTRTVTDGSSITLTASPDANSTFAGWSGGICSGTSTTCTISSGGGVVIANFDKKPVLQESGVQNTGAGVVAVAIKPAEVLPEKLNLAPNSTSPSVKFVQEFLNNNGYPVATFGPGSRGFESTFFGPATVLALKKYQCEVLNVCSGSTYGTLDTATYAAIKKGVTKAGTQPVTLPSVATGGKYTFKRSLTIGASGEDVRQLQLFLNKNGFTIARAGAGSPGKESTFFGPATRLALIRYQLAKKITPAAGFFGPTTRARVMSGK
jgi:hypothetical protein